MMNITSVSMVNNRTIMNKNSVMTKNVNFKGSPQDSAAKLAKNVLGGVAATQKMGIFSRIGLIFQNLRFKFGLLKPTNVKYFPNGKIASQEFPNGAYKRFSIFQQDGLINSNKEPHPGIYYMSEIKTPSGGKRFYKPVVNTLHYRDVIGINNWDFWYHSIKPILVKEQLPNGTVINFNTIKLDFKNIPYIGEVIHPNGTIERYSVTKGQTFMGDDKITKHYLSYTKAADGKESFLRPNGKLEKEILPDGMVINYAQDGGIMTKTAPDGKVIESNIAN